MRLVVIGGVAAGMSAAARARRLDPAAEIIVLEKGTVVSYGACGMPYFLEGRVPRWEKLVAHTPESFARERNVTVRTGAEVTAISHGKREVRLSDGEAIKYDRLVIATGARASLAGIANTNAPRVFTLNTIYDAIRLKDHLSRTPPGRAAVVGAGYIGLETVEALRANGWRVRLLTRSARLLGRAEEWLTQALREHLERFRVEVSFGEVIGDTRQIGADLIVLAAGLKPNVEIAAEAGVELGRTGAIRVTDRAETNLHGVFAAGDCAETNHLVTGRPVWIPLGTTANKTGRVAGANAAGRRERFPGVVGTSIVRVCGLGAAFTGLSSEAARSEGFQPVSARIAAMDKPRYFGGRTLTVELTADRATGRLLGAAVLGDKGVEGRINTAATAISQRMTVEDLETLDLAYAPPFATVWDPLLIAAQQLIKLVH